MKKDIYLKIILTVITIFLVWICIRDIKIGSHGLQVADDLSYGVQRVCVVSIDPLALIKPIEVDQLPLIALQPFEVEVINFPTQWIPGDNQ